MNADAKHPTPQAPGRHGAAEPQPCVWAAAGVLSYGLCPRDYDCDACPLHRSLLGLETGVAPSAAESGDALHVRDAAPLGHLRVPLRRRRGVRYHRSHVWLRDEGEGRVRLGLDDLLGRLAEGCDGWRVAGPGERLAIGDRLAHARIGARRIDVASPLAGRVVSRNDALVRHPDLLTWSPYDAGWLAEIELDASVDRVPGLLHGERATEGWLDAELDRLAQLRSEGRLDAAAGSPVGPTLADGGLPRCSLKDALGAEGLELALRAFFPGAR